MSEDRFSFGRNWRRFLRVVDESHVAESQRVLREMLGVARLDGITFLDAGSGSGLSSAAAHRLGADVHSFDYDIESVECTLELRRRFGCAPSAWVVEQGSVLDHAYLDRLGTFDIVYSWGVLHHTGDLDSALANVASLVADRGLLFIAIYNDQGVKSALWSAVKQAYVRWRPLRPLLLAAGAVGFFVPVAVRDLLRGRPFEHFRTYGRRRGMSPWTDLIDWLGGWPFEVASVGELERWLDNLGFDVVTVVPTRGLGCNELVLRRR